MGEFSPGRWWRKEAKEVTKSKIMNEIAARSGYDMKTFMKRLRENAYDAIMILKDVEHMATQNFFFNHFSISPYDLPNRCKLRIPMSVS